MDNIKILLALLFYNFAATEDKICPPPDPIIYANCTTLNGTMQRCECAGNTWRSADEALFISLYHEGDCQWKIHDMSFVEDYTCFHRLHLSCWSSVPVAGVICPAESEHVPRHVGHKRYCVCKTNCAPVTLTCLKLKGGDDDRFWSYNQTGCYKKTSYALSSTLSVSYENDSYTFTCKDGYQLTGKVDNATCSQGKLHPVPACQLLPEDPLSCTTIRVVTGVIYFVYFVGIAAAIVFCIYRLHRRNVRRCRRNTRAAVEAQPAPGSNDERPRSNPVYEDIDAVLFKLQQNVANTRSTPLETGL